MPGIAVSGSGVAAQWGDRSIGLWDAPANAVAQTMIRSDVEQHSVAYLASGTLRLNAIYLRAGVACANITFVSGSTALSAGVNQWFGLFDSGGVMQRLTADDTNTAWGTQSLKTLALTSSYTPATSGLYYVGILINGTVPSLSGKGANGSNTLTGVAPALAGVSSAGLTNPASCPGTVALPSGNTSGVVYAYVT